MSARDLRAALAAGIIAVLPCRAASAQSPASTLIVHVVDPSGAAVAHARVSASTRDARLFVTADSDGAGDAAFSGLVPGRYVIEVGVPGFAPAARPIALRPGSTRLTVALELAAIAERVLVTGTGHLQTTAETSKAITVIAAEDLIERQEASVAGALRAVPGALVQQLGGPGAFTSVRLRGLREPDTAWLIDGVRFRDAASSQGDASPFISDLAPVGIERIEVLRGSASSLYGTHAVGGVVNLITTTGRGGLSGRATAEAGGLGFRRAGAYTGGGLGGDRVTFSAGAAHARTVHGIDGDDAARSTSFQGRMDVRLGASARATGRVYATGAESSLNESPAALAPLPAAGIVPATPATFAPPANDPDSVRNGTFVSALLRFEHRASEALGYTMTLHRLTTARTFRDGPQGVAFEPLRESVSSFTGAIDTVELQADYAWSARHATRLVVEFERERYESETVPDERALAWTADVVQDSHALAVQHEVRLSAIEIAGSLRAQRFRLRRVALTPPERAPFAAATFSTQPAALTADVAAARNIAGTGTKLRAHAGNGYRAPAMFERAGVFFDSRGFSVLGDPRLGPERSISMDAGVDQRVAGGRVLASLTWFHTRLARVISFQSLDAATDPFGRDSGYAAGEGRTARGLEAGARVRPGPDTGITLTYTFVDAPPNGGDRAALPRATAIPAHRFAAHVTQRAGALDVSFGIESAGAHFSRLFDPVTFDSRVFRFSGHVTADLAASYRMRMGRARTRLFAIVDNVFDRRYFIQGFRVPGRVARAGVEVTW